VPSDVPSEPAEGLAQGLPKHMPTQQATTGLTRAGTAVLESGRRKTGGAALPEIGPSREECPDVGGLRPFAPRLGPIDRSRRPALFCSDRPSEREVGTLEGIAMKMLGRLAAVAGAVVVVGLAAPSPVWASDTVDINPGNVPTTAADHGDHECNFGGGPFADRDVWVFVLPGSHDKVGDFVSVTAVFGANGSLTIPADGGAIVTDKGTSKAWITTPAGWTLTGASAVVTGTAEKFNLTHTCPAGGGGETPTPTPSGSGSPSTPASPSASASGASGGGSGGGNLPVTGAATMTTAVVGSALVVGGVALLAVRRRREAPAFAADDSAGDGDRG
jgi:LPXTG-motif cell wall-anchored protein